jgi:hypothetical protein
MTVVSVESDPTATYAAQAQSLCVIQNRTRGPDDSQIVNIAGNTGHWAVAELQVVDTVRSHPSVQVDIISESLYNSPH